MRSKKLNIVLTGEFSAGKSSLLNWLMGDSILKVDVAPTTGEIYKITYSCNKEINHWREKGCDIYEIKYPFEKLRMLKNVVLWDTPGLSSSNNKHESCIDYAFENAHAFLLIVDSTTGTLKRTLIERLKNFADKPIALLISKADKVSSLQLGKIKEFIEKTANSYFPNMIYSGSTSVVTSGGAVDFLTAIERLSKKITLLK